MKALIQKLINYYNTNSTFHALVAGFEGAVVSAVTAWIVTLGYGIPTTKANWVALGAFVAKAAWGWFKRWLQTNEATVGVETK